MSYKILLISALTLLVSANSCLAQGRAQINIAHRGACGYLPEHTLPAKALAYGQNPDFIEQDVVLSKDMVPIVIHDIHLDTVTDVAKKFPQRKRDDQRYYAADFTLAEIKTLNVHERIDLKTGAAVFPGRFPVGRSVFRIPTLAEEIELIQGLNKSCGRNIGIYPEIKEPAWHRENNMDISAIVLKTLADYGYDKRESNCFLQCFDQNELKRIKTELKSELRLIQLLEGECNLDEVASYAVGIGPWIGQIISGKDADGKPIMTELVKEAKARNLLVHPYTFRVDAPVHDFAPDQLLKILFNSAHVDGIFSDFPDVSAEFLKKNNLE